MLNAYCAKASQLRQILPITSMAAFLSPFSGDMNAGFERQPPSNEDLSSAMIFAFFLPIALRSVSDWPRVKLASALDMSITCSW